MKKYDINITTERTIFGGDQEGTYPSMNTEQEKWLSKGGAKGRRNAERESDWVHHITSTYDIIQRCGHTCAHQSFRNK